MRVIAAPSRPISDEWFDSDYFNKRIIPMTHKLYSHKLRKLSIINTVLVILLKAIFNVVNICADEYARAYREKNH